MRNILIAASAVLGLSTLYARSDDNLRFVRHVPEGATIQYAVKGQVLQAVDLRPGSYEIIVRRLGRTGE